MIGNLVLGVWGLLSPVWCSSQSVPIELDTPDRSLAKVVLLAGEPSSKPGQHEYVADSILMMKWLKQIRGVWPVLVRTWPTNESLFDHTRCVVVLMDGGAKHPLVEEPRWRKLRELTDEDMGYVVLHQAVDFPKAHLDDVKATIGGVWQADIGCRGHWDMSFKPQGTHPVLRGVEPFTAKGDGWLYNLHFVKEGYIPLLAGAVPDKSRTTPDAKKHVGREEVIAWAYEREGGGRAFCFTGVDLHENWKLESQRKLVVNGILWAAKLEVPKDGAKTELQPGDLEMHVRRAESKPQAPKNTPPTLK